MFKKPKERAFYPVALSLILFGVTVATLGGVFWILNMYYDYSFFAPSIKVIGGAIICALGYIVLELELIREK